MRNTLTIVLLGGSGFVGQALLREFASWPAGSVRVRALLRHPASVPDYPFLHKVQGSLEACPDDLEPAEPYVLLHFAVQHLDPHGRGFTRTNVDATRQLLERLGSRLSGVVYGSSMSVYGQGHQEGIDESAPPRPDTDLAKSRWQAEQAIMEIAQKRSISAFMLRPRYVLGQGDRFVLPSLARLVTKRISIGHGQQRFSVIDVADYARVIARLSHQAMMDRRQSLPRQCPLNVGYEQPISYADLTGQIAQAIEARKPRWSVPVTARLTRWLRLLPFRAGEKLVTKLELIGLSHWGRVDALAAVIGNELIRSDPVATVRRAADHLQKSTFYPAVPHENPRQL